MNYEIGVNYLLTTFSGYPSSFSFFCPDPGLPKLASYLNSKGNNAQVLDFNTLSLLEYCLSDEKITVDDLKSQKQMALKELELNKKFFINAEFYIYEELRGRIKGNKIDVLGVKIWFGQSFSIFLNIFSKLKAEFPDLLISIGGPAISGMGEDLIYFVKNVDFICFGEGEIHLEDVGKLVKGHFTKDLVSNCFYLGSNGYSFSLSTSKRGLFSDVDISYDEDVYIGIDSEKLPLYIIEESKGCIFECAFCNHPNIGQKKILNNPIEHVFRQMLKLEKTKGAKIFRFSGSCPPPSFFNNLSKIITENKKEYVLGAFFHHIFHKNVNFDLMEKAGFRSLLVGVESVSESNNEVFLEKKVDIRELKKLGEKLDGRNIFVSQSFIFPQMEGDLSEYKKYLSNYPFDISNSSIAIFYPVVYPNTKWWKNPQKYKIAISDKKDHLNKIFFGRSSSSSITINRKTPKKLQEEYANAIKETRQSQVFLGATDEIALMAYGAGIDLRNFHFQQSLSLKSYDKQKIVNLFNLVNTRMRKNA